MRHRRSDDISLRELLELRIDGLVEAVKSQGELFDKKLEGLASTVTANQATLDAARKIEAAELARRLDILNHGHERAVEVQQTYLRQDLYDRDSREYRVWRDGMSLELAGGRERAAQLSALDARVKIVESFIATAIGRDTGSQQTITDRRASAGEVRAYIALAITVVVFVILYIAPRMGGV